MKKPSFDSHDRNLILHLKSKKPCWTAIEDLWQKRCALPPEYPGDKTGIALWLLELVENFCDNKDMATILWDMSPAKIWEFSLEGIGESHWDNVIKVLASRLRLTAVWNFPGPL